MAVRHPHSNAVRLAGELYGKILDRNADKPGFDYVLDSLSEGRKSVRHHAIEMVLSDEFESRFVQGRKPGEVVALLHRILLGQPVAAADLGSELDRYTRLRFKPYVEQLTRSDVFQRKTGEGLVPGLGH